MNATSIINRLTIKKLPPPLIFFAMPLGFACCQQNDAPMTTMEMYFHESQALTPNVFRGLSRFWYQNHLGKALIRHYYYVRYHMARRRNNLLWLAVLHWFCVKNALKDDKNRSDKGLAPDILEQMIRYTTILLDYADESKQDFDELLIERNRYGAIWLHFAVRPKDNRRKVAFIQA